LRREAKLVERHIFGRFLDAPLDLGLLFQRAGLGGDETEYDDLVALGQKAQRIETAGARGVVSRK
jgi:hypothetical protein